jgi:glycosyltransferase involved in cell wall biosynthesis
MVRTLHEHDWDCHVAMPGPSPMAAAWSAAGATLHQVPMRRITTSGGLGHWIAYAIEWPVAVWRLAALARRLQVDVVHTNSLHSWYGWAAAKLARRPHVWHGREIVVQSRAALRVEQQLLRFGADQVMAMSGAIAAQFPGVPPARMHIVIDEADPERFRPDNAGRFRDDVGIPDDRLVVGAVGRLDTWKGIEVLLDAVPMLDGHSKDVLVVVAGPAVRGKERYATALEERARRLGVGWLGPVDDVPSLMADLDVFVMPSTEPEPFGIVMVEALASGVPVVATAAGGPLEILGDASLEVGRLVPIGDAPALAQAVIDLLPVNGTSTDLRRHRKPLRQAPPPEYAAVLELAIAGYARASR